MTATTPVSGRRTGAPSAPSRPAERLLRTATKLFSEQGIRAVGVDELLRQAGVAKASLYSSYGSKDALVVAYLEALDHADRNRWTRATATIAEPVDRVLAFFDLAVTAAESRDFRGCLYANAASEYPGRELVPVRQHRDWFRDTVSALLADAGIADAHAAARDIQLIYDGGLLGSKLERSSSPIRHGRALALHRIAGARHGDD
jgi:AcrR family transcriptional regulator